MTTTTVSTTFFGAYKVETTDGSFTKDGKIIELYEEKRYLFGILIGSFRRSMERSKGLKDAFSSLFNGSIEEGD